MSLFVHNGYDQKEIFDNNSLIWLCEQFQQWKSYMSVVFSKKAKECVQLKLFYNEHLI